jgi:LAO/AO transport system kinase
MAHSTPSPLMQVSNLNPGLHSTGRRRHRLDTLNVQDFAEGIRCGDRVLLSRAITLLESNQTARREMGVQILDACMPFRAPSFRLGVTGAPGVGKSTFIESFGQFAGQRGHRIAVLAVDPSSSITRGSILGDKTRMPGLATADYAYVRPSPAGDSLGGVAQMTRETTLLCEAAGFDLILVETVGVGQSEMAVYSMVDFFLLLLLPGAGDELQGIKRGIVEMADLLVVNKADGARLSLAMQARGAYLNALHLFPPKSNGWSPQVLTCSATTGEGIEQVWETMEQFRVHTFGNGAFQERRQLQALSWMEEQVQSELRRRFRNHPAVKENLQALEHAVLCGQIAPSAAAQKLLDVFTGQKQNIEKK